MIHIFYNCSAERLKENSFRNLLGQLPLSIQNEVLKYRKWEDQQRSLFGKLLLLEGLRSAAIGKYALEDLKYTEFQKPYFDNIIDFNISHSGEFTICAINKAHKIGVDIEEIKAIPIADFERQFSKSQWEKIMQAQDGLAFFYTLWTQKEAFIKAIGTGLNVPLDEINIMNDIIIWNGKKWYLHELKLDQRYISHLSTPLIQPELVIEKVDFG